MWVGQREARSGTSGGVRTFWTADIPHVKAIGCGSTESLRDEDVCAWNGVSEVFWQGVLG